MLLNGTTAIVRVYTAVRISIHWLKRVMPGTMGGAEPISTSGNRASLCHQQQQQTQVASEMFSVDSRQ